MAALVTVDVAKQHLYVQIDDNNADIALKVDQASAIILTYMKGQAVAGWSDGSVDVPGNVSAAVLIVLEGLHERKPIDWEAVGRVLVGMRDPALA